MGLIDRFGRIADTYISEKENLAEAEEERKRVFVGHPFWPTEILRDTIRRGKKPNIQFFYF